MIALAIRAAGLLLTLVPSVPVIVLGLLIFSTSGILIQAGSTGYVASAAPTGTSSAVGLYVSFFYLGGTVGGWLPGFAYEAVGWPGAIAIVLAMMAIMAAIVVRFWRD